MFEFLRGYAAPPIPQRFYSDAGPDDQPMYYQQPPADYVSPYLPPPRRVPKLPILAVIFSVLAVVMVGASLFLPWYAIKLDMTMEMYSTPVDMTLDVKYAFEGESSTTSASVMGASMSQTCSTSWDDERMTGNHKKGVFKATQGMDILAFVMSLMLLVGSAVTVFRTGLKVMAIIFGALALVLCLLAPIYFMAELPPAFKNDEGKSDISASGISGLEDLANGDGPWSTFSGSRATTLGMTYEGTPLSVPLRMSWGPDSGWFLALMGFVFSTLGLLAAGLAKRPSEQPGIPGACPAQPHQLPPPVMGYPAQPYAAPTQVRFYEAPAPAVEAPLQEPVYDAQVQLVDAYQEAPPPEPRRRQEDAPRQDELYDAQVQLVEAPAEDPASETDGKQ